MAQRSVLRCCSSALSRRVRHCARSSTVLSRRGAHNLHGHAQRAGMCRRSFVSAMTLSRKFCSHSDFSTTWKTGDVGDIKAQVEKDVTENQVFLFMKGTPMQPMCGFSKNVVQILQTMEVSFESRDVLSHPALREVIKEYSNWPTFPQLWVKGELIGGHDIVVDMFKNGELDKVLLESGDTE